MRDRRRYHQQELGKKKYKVPVQVVSREQKGKMAEKAAYPCVKFEMALNAGFQECGTCGWAKDQHKPMVRKKLKKAAEKNGLKSAVVGGKKEIQKEAEPCRNYNRNLQAVEYDTCDCRLKIIFRSVIVYYWVIYTDTVGDIGFIGGWSLEEHQKADAERARLAQEEEERRQAAANTVCFWRYFMVLGLKRRYGYSLASTNEYVCIFLWLFADLYS